MAEWPGLDLGVSPPEMSRAGDPETRWHDRTETPGDNAERAELGLVESRPAEAQAAADRRLEQADPAEPDHAAGRQPDRRPQHARDRRRWRVDMVDRVEDAL